VALNTINQPTTTWLGIIKSDGAEIFFWEPKVLLLVKIYGHASVFHHHVNKIQIVTNSWVSSIVVQNAES
jgi:hypothetical protein